MGRTPTKSAGQGGAKSAADILKEMACPSADLPERLQPSAAPSGGRAQNTIPASTFAGTRATAWSLLIHADASPSLFLPRHSKRVSTLIS